MSDKIPLFLVYLPWMTYWNVTFVVISILKGESFKLLLITTFSYDAVCIIIGKILWNKLLLMLLRHTKRMKDTLL